MRKQLWLSIGLSLLLLAGGGAGVYYLSHYFQGQPVYAKSMLAAQIPKVKKGSTQSHKKTLDLKTIIHNTQKDVVQIEVTTQQGKVIGSGFLYNKKGDVVTNAHVVNGASQVTVQTEDGQKYSGKVIGIGDTVDVAVVRVSSLANHTPLNLATKRKAQLGDKVLALGSPLALQNTVTTGIISGVNRDFTIAPYTYHHVYQIDAPITHGNSGGPLVDQKTGEVLGINSAGTDTSGNIGFSIPIPDIYSTLKNWSDHPSASTHSDGKSPTAITNHMTGQALKTSGEKLVQYYYQCIDSHDYVTAYSLLGSRFQSSISYDKFRAGYINTIDVTINNLTSTLNGNEVKVTIITQADERKNGTTQTSLYKDTYTIGYEDDHLKILSGSGKKL